MSSPAKRVSTVEHQEVERERWDRAEQLATLVKALTQRILDLERVRFPGAKERCRS